MRTRQRPWIEWHDSTRLKTALLAALALLFQGYVGQAHFHHFAAFEPGHALAAIGGAPLTDGDIADLPADRSEEHRADCAICHLSGHGAAVIAPIIVLILPSLTDRSPWPARSIAASIPSTAHPAPRGPPISFVQS